VSSHPLDAVVRGDRAIAVIRAGSAESALRMSHACLQAGLRLLEVTLTVPDALGVVRELSSVPEAIVGVGTVLTRDDVRRSAEAGARFAISPHFDPDVLAAEKAAGLYAIMAGLTPTELLACHRGGVDLVKLYPAHAVGGPSYVRTVRQPLPFLQLVCNGGVDETNAAAYLEAGAVGVGVAPAALEPRAFAAGDWAAVSAAVGRVMGIVRGVPGRPA
jgi:2-dehydro-3-deoxyphosphogluconate aldolase/(4S)-4-hydroxy-2-oxoglutarate aldolase